MGVIASLNTASPSELQHFERSTIRTASHHQKFSFHPAFSVQPVAEASEEAHKLFTFEPEIRGPVPCSKLADFSYEGPNCCGCTPHGFVQALHYSSANVSV